MNAVTNRMFWAGEEKQHERLRNFKKEMLGIFEIVEKFLIFICLFLLEKKKVYLTL